MNSKTLKKLFLIAHIIKNHTQLQTSTMPNIASVLSGLSPLQHGFGDYNNSIHNSQFNEKIIFLPEILKTKNLLVQLILFMNVLIHYMDLLKDLIYGLK